jgi:signal transduction histidine kinase
VARRVRRLEVAARRVAAGRSFAPLPIDSEDELGQLTRTFNEMQEQLARTERARREFVANASHELRTPIFSLGGFAELLQDEDLDEATRDRFLASMREQIDRLQRLSADLLDLSRLDAGALTIHPRQVDLSEVAGTVVSEFIPAAAAKGAALEIDLPDGDLEAWCDPDRVAQIVRILLDNALRHNPEGTRIVLSALRRGGEVELAIADSGPALGPAVAERVFERFYTADAASGSGLGLAIAQELARRMDGRLELLSRREHKAFTLVLPVAPDGAPRPATGARARRGADAERPTDEPLAGAATPGDRRAAG